MNSTAFLYLSFVSFLGIVTTLVLPFPLPKWLKISIGPALGIIITTELMLITSLLVGFGRFSIFLTVCFYFIAQCIVAVKSKQIIFLHTLSKKGSWSFKPSSLSSMIKKMAINYWSLILTLIIIGLPVTYIFWTKVLYPTSFGLTTGGGGLYGDTALHSAYTMSIVEQGLPPTNPLFAGIPLVYPFLVNLFSASLVALGMNLRFAFILPHLVYFFGFVTLFYYVARKVSDNLGAFFALLIFFLGWGLGFTHYLADSKSGSLFPTREYTNNLPGFNMHNALTGLIFPERSFLPGLFIGMLITSLMLPVLIKKPPTYNLKLTTHNLQLITIGMLLGILPLWHTHTFIFFGVAIGIWYVFCHPERVPNEVEGRVEASQPSNYNPTGFFSRFRSFRMTIMVRQVIITYSLAFVLAFPALLWFRGQVTHASFIHFTLGWMDSKTNPLHFWFQNTGLVIPLALLGIFLLKKRGFVFFLPAVIMFAIANIVIFQPWDWDNIKLFSWVFLFFSIAAGCAIARLLTMTPPLPLLLRGGWGALTKITVFVCLISLTASGTLSLILLSSQTFGIYDNQDMELVAWIKTNTKPQDVFLVDPWPNHPVPGLSGRSVYLGYPGHLWVHGINYSEREAQVHRILAGDSSSISTLETPMSYIVAEKSKAQPLVNQHFTVLFENQKFVVFTK